MQRQLEPELLDGLAADDPAALGSRRDLRWLNFFMGNVGLMARTLKKAFPHKPPRHILDLGGGDGDFLLKVCRALPGDWQGIDAILVDRHKVLASTTVEAFAARGWAIQVAEAEVFDYLNRRVAPFVDVILANLVLHHFSDGQIRELFSLLEEGTTMFLAVEPRRSPTALMFSRSVRLIGCNAVTRHDAPASVLAGFEGRELSALWRDKQGWVLEEEPAGLFSHLFVSSRIQQ